MMGRVGYGTVWYSRPAGQIDPNAPLQGGSITFETDVGGPTTPGVVQVPLNDAAAFGAKLETGLWDEQGRPTSANTSLVAEATAPVQTAVPSPRRTDIPPDYTPWLNLASQTVGASSDVIIAAIRGQNETERMRLEADTARQIRALTYNTTMNAQDRARAQVALQSLMQLLLIRRAETQRQQSAQSNTLMFVLIGGVLFVGLTTWALTR
jgi:hypothetical protein